MPRSQPPPPYAQWVDRPVGRGSIGLRPLKYGEKVQLPLAFCFFCGHYHTVVITRVVSATRLGSDFGGSTAPETFAEQTSVRTRGRREQEAEPMIHAAETTVTAPDKSWQDFANCLGVDPDLFFPERGASTREAKEVCRGCVVREDCLEYALANGEKFGIWGGMSERERRRIRRRRALQRRADGTAAS